MDPLSLLVLALAFAILSFAAVFVLARRVDNFGIVDVAWSFGFAPIALLYASAADGDLARRVTLAVIVGIWSVRLGGYLGWRVLRQHPSEDGRYQQLRRDWGDKLSLKMFFFFQAQAVLLVVLSAPFLFVATHRAAPWHPLEVAGLALWFTGLLGETVADAQLARFKREPANHGRVCDMGLWRFSRHPNYFFEWLVWVGFALFASSAPWGWTSIYCPLLMLLSLLKFTGVKSTEDQLLRSKGEPYREYQRRTSAFFPWFSKRGASP